MNATPTGPLSSGLPTPGAHPRHFSFSAGPHPSSMLQAPNPPPSHGENIPRNATQMVQPRRESMDDQAVTAAAAAAAQATGFEHAPHQQTQQQIEPIPAATFSPSYHYATPSPSGDNESSLGVASYDPMFGTVPTNSFSSPTPWHGVEDHRKQSHGAAPSPGERSHNDSPGTGPGEEKDPFLSLLEQLAENEHAIGQGKEIDFFLTGAQG